MPHNPTMPLEEAIARVERILTPSFDEKLATFTESVRFTEHGVKGQKWGEKKDNEKEFYHGTTVGIAKKVMKQGLKTSGSHSVRRTDEYTKDLVTQRGFVYLTKNRKTAEEYARAKVRAFGSGSKPAVVVVRIPKDRISSGADYISKDRFTRGGLHHLGSISNKYVDHFEKIKMKEAVTRFEEKLSSFQESVKLQEGGRGSGCHGSNCGRPSRPKGVVFHGTPVRHVSGILKKGLQVRNAIAGRGIYTTDRFKSVVSYALGEQDPRNMPKEAAVVVIKNWKGIPRHAEWGSDKERDPVFEKPVGLKNIHHVEVYKVSDLVDVQNGRKSAGSLKPTRILRP